MPRSSALVVPLKAQKREGFPCATIFYFRIKTITNILKLRRSHREKTYFKKADKSDILELLPYGEVT